MVQKIIAKALSRPPAGYSHWSTPQLAKVFHLGKTVVHKILRANNVKPHLTRTLKVSKDPRFDEKTTDVVGLYVKPAGKRDCVERRREDVGASPGTNSTDVASYEGAARAPHARLQAQRSCRPLRGRSQSRPE
jgi:hypothetical protein